jgi:hypothetical protein
MTIQVSSHLSGKGLGRRHDGRFVVTFCALLLHLVSPSEPRFTSTSRACYTPLPTWRYRADQSEPRELLVATMSGKYAYRGHDPPSDELVWPSETPGVRASRVPVPSPEAPLAEAWAGRQAGGEARFRSTRVGCICTRDATRADWKSADHCISPPPPTHPLDLSTSPPFICLSAHASLAVPMADPNAAIYTV